MEIMCDECDGVATTVVDVCGGMDRLDLCVRCMKWCEQCRGVWTAYYQCERCSQRVCIDCATEVTTPAETDGRQYCMDCAYAMIREIRGHFFTGVKETMSTTESISSNNDDGEKKGTKRAHGNDDSDDGNDVKIQRSMSVAAPASQCVVVVGDDDDDDDEQSTVTSVRTGDDDEDEFEDDEEGDGLSDTVRAIVSAVNGATPPETGGESARDRLSEVCGYLQRVEEGYGAMMSYLRMVKEGQEAIVSRLDTMVSIFSDRR